MKKKPEQKIDDDFDVYIKPIYTKSFKLKVKKFKISKFEPKPFFE